MFYYDKEAGMKVLKSGLLSGFEGKIRHLFTTRESLIKTKDTKLNKTAKANRERILKALNIENKNLVEIKQTHSTNVIIGFNKGFLGDDNVENPGIIDDTDGVILYKPGMATILNFADCTPVILYDPENHVIAGLHAGWRGTAGEISKKGLKIMEENFGTKPAETLAVIGPAIAQDDFECGIEVYDALKNTFRVPQDKDFQGEELFKFKKDKVFPDLARINARQLKDLGVQKIEISEYKTTKDRENLFSYRAENGTTNRISVVLKLENPPR